MCVLNTSRFSSSLSTAAVLLRHTVPTAFGSVCVYGWKCILAAATATEVCRREEGEENPLLSLFFLIRIKPKSRNTRRPRPFPSPHPPIQTRTHALTQRIFLKKPEKVYFKNKLLLRGNNARGTNNFSFALTYAIFLCCVRGNPF